MRAMPVFPVPVPVAVTVIIIQMAVIAVGIMVSMVTFVMMPGAMVTVMTRIMAGTVVFRV